jgi:hypothetical protein
MQTHLAAQVVVAVSSVVVGSVAPQALRLTHPRLTMVQRLQLPRQLVDLVAMPAMLYPATAVLP